MPRDVAKFSAFSALYYCLALLLLLATLTEAKWKDYRTSLQTENLDETFKSLGPQSLITNHRLLQQASIMNYTCARDIAVVEQALYRRETWALKMLDASSKIPSGLLEGNIIDLGMYDECMSVRGRSLSVNVRGRHCMYSIAATHGNATVPINPTLSICLPATCDGQNLIELLNGTINTVSRLKTLGIEVASASCVDIDPVVWDNQLIACVTILSVFVGFYVTCSVCEGLRSQLNAGEYRHPALRVLSQFSLQRSASSIFNTEIREGTLPAIHGIRFLSIAWIVLGHEYVLQVFAANVNLLDIVDWVQSWKSLYIFIAPFAVDTFFAISGFLMTYLFMKKITRQRKFNVPLYYLHRYLRLTPVVGALTVFAIVIVPKLGSGARWDMLINIFVGEQCQRKWWVNLLYLQNIVDQDNMCLGHLWYLAVDMQLFWISPMILYPLYKVPKYGLGFLGFLILASITVPASIVGINAYPAVSFTHNPNVTLVMDIFKNVYEMPYNRAGPWLIGIYFGYEVAGKHLRLSKLSVYLGWALTVASFVFCTFGTRSFMEPSYVYNPFWETFFTAMSRHIWAFGVCWLIYASVNGYGGPVTRFLSWKIFLPLSRLSYCIYLVHIVVMNMQISALRVPRYFSSFLVWNYYLSDFAISIALALVFSLLFEWPVLVFEKLVFRRRRQDQQPHYEPQKNDEEDEESTRTKDTNGHSSN